MSPFAPNQVEVCRCWYDITHLVQHGAGAPIDQWMMDGLFRARHSLPLLLYNQQLEHWKYIPTSCMQIENLDLLQDKHYILLYIKQCQYFSIFVFALRYRVEMLSLQTQLNWIKAVGRLVFYIKAYCWPIHDLPQSITSPAPHYWMYYYFYYHYYTSIITKHNLCLCDCKVFLLFVLYQLYPYNPIIYNNKRFFWFFR